MGHGGVARRDLAVTERGGRMRHVRANGSLSEPIRGVPEVVAKGQGGLLDVAIRDDFERTRRVWWSFLEPRGNDGNATAVATGVLASDGSALSDVRVIFQQQPAWLSTNHFGSRLVFDRTGALFVTTGERSLPDPGNWRRTLELISARSFGSIRTAELRKAIHISKAACRKSGRTVIGTCRLPRWVPMARYGRSSMVPAAATNSTDRKQARTMAGRS